MKSQSPAFKEHRHVAAANEVEQLAGTNMIRTWGWVFTKNATGDTGYVIRTNGAIGQPYTQACIIQKLHYVTLDDARNTGVPPTVLIAFKASKATMESVCSKEAPDSFCGYHNEMLHDLDDDGQEVMYHGLNIDGDLIILVGSSNGKFGGLTLTHLETGIMIMDHLFQKVGYQPQGIDELETLPPR